jgi:hypothetical protein
MIAAGTTGLPVATVAAAARAAARARPETAEGTPEQVHLTWGDDPARSVVVSWASAGQAIRPRVRIGQRVISAHPRSYTDKLSGEVSWTYHALVDGLRPGATYGYAVTADNDGNAADPFSATLTTAPDGRAAFRFTSFGDLARPDSAWAGSHGQAAHAVGAVEAFQPLFHLLNGDLAGGDMRRDPANNTQASAANRPWMPVTGNHALEVGNREQGLDFYLTRYTLPANGIEGMEGRWYAFRVGTVLFVCLSGDDVAYQDAGAFADGYSGGAQTRWLDSTLAGARADASVDWIVVQMHQCACSSSDSGNGSDLGVREKWLPLFDRYEVDLVLAGHDHGYERSFPVRGYDAEAGSDAETGAPVDTRRPRPVTTVDSGVFDTSQGTVHLVLGCGDAPGSPVPRAALSTVAWADSGQSATARVFTRPNGPVPDAVETATWSARRDTASGYGIAVFDVNPGTDTGGQTSITARYYHAAGADAVSPATGEPGAPSGDYSLFETFTLVRPRSDGRRWYRKR